MTIRVKYGNRARSSKLRLAGSLTLIGLYLLSPFWLSGAWGQQTRRELRKPLQTEQRTPAQAPAALQPVAPNPIPVALPVANPSSALGIALASCETGAEASDLSLPGTKGEIKLDRCYRGRDHLVCQFNALMAEAKSLLENYRKVVDANYPEVRDVSAICVIKSDTLTNDLQNATNFASRFRSVKAEYEARVSCTNRIEQSFKDVTLTDMTQAQALLKSMIDVIEGDVKGVSAIQGKLSELAEKMDTSQKAMVPLQKIHRAMCITHQAIGTENKPQ